MSITGVNNTSNNMYQNTYSTNDGKQAAVSNERTNSWSALPVQPNSEVVTECTYSVPQNHELAKCRAEEETTFPFTNICMGYEKYIKALDEHYSKVNEENKKFPNPDLHIWEKYYNSRSPYYVKGLTQREREICYNSELRVLDGGQPALNSYDPVLQEKFGGCDIFTADMEYNQEIRNSLNDVINQIFKENGIVIPENAELKLTVNPYDYYISASGVDETLGKRIEEILNKGNNGYYLWSHISLCDPINYGVMAEQYAGGDNNKMALWHMVNRLTGYDLREMENRDGKFYTPEGEDLWKVVEQKYSEFVADGMGSFDLGDYYQTYERLAKRGWNDKDSADSDLSLIYKNGYLYDVGMEDYGYGPGQTAWQDRVYSWSKGVQAEYRKEREETLRREESMPTEWELFLQENERKMKELEDETHMVRQFMNGVKVKASNMRMIFDEEKFSELQKKVNRLQKEGLLVPLTNTILSIHSMPAIQRFDSKA